MIQLRAWGPSIVWMATLFAASSRPVPATIATIPDWLTHGAAYAILGASFARALSLTRGARIGRDGVFAVALATAYGVSDEYHQSFVSGRHASVDDVVKDGCGAAVGAVVHRFGGRRTRRAFRE